MCYSINTCGHNHRVQSEVVYHWGCSVKNLSRFWVTQLRITLYLVFISFVSFPISAVLKNLRSNSSHTIYINISQILIPKRT